MKKNLNINDGLLDFAIDGSCSVEGETNFYIIGGVTFKEV